MTAAFDHPAIDSRFINGERTIAVSSVVDEAAMSVYRISRFLNLPHGIYNIKWFSRANSILRMGQGLASLTQVLQSTSGVLVNTQVYLDGGDVRLDIELNGSGIGVDTGVVFLIYSPDKVIYASNADGWGFDVGVALADAALTEADDPRLAMPVWSVLPNWRDGITERVEYLTNEETSESGAIQTRVLREVPRRSFELEFMRAGVRRARMDSFSIGTGREPFLAPLWHEQYRPSSGIAAGQDTISFPTDTLHMREYRVGDIVIVTMGDPQHYELLTVENIVGDNLVFVSSPVENWSAGCRVAPMRKAVVTDQSSLSNVTDRVGTLRMRFTLVERDTGFGESWGYCSPLWRFPINWANSVNVDYDRNTFEFDNQTGVPYSIDPGDRAIVLTRAQASFVGREATYALRRFLQAAKGRARRFWMPSLTKDLTPTGTISGISFLIERAGLSDYIKTTQSARKMLGFVFADGSPTIYREIVSLQASGESELVTLDLPLPTLDPSSIERIQFVMPTRFDQDAFELKHLVDDSGAVTAAFSFRSADIEGMPPIQCGVTSWTYPIAEIDELSVSAAITSLRFGGIPDTSDSMDVAADVTGLSVPLVVAYKSAGTPSDSLDMSASITQLSVPLVVGYKTLPDTSDAMNVAGAITSMSYPLVVNYINYVIDAESLNITAAITSVSSN